MSIQAATDRRGLVAGSGDATGSFPNPRRRTPPAVVLTPQPMTERQRQRVFANETALRKAAHAWLRQIPFTKLVKIHGSAFGEAGIPDTLMVWRGLAVWFEWKVPGNKASAIQETQMRRLRHAGSPCFVCYSLADVETAVRAVAATM